MKHRDASAWLVALIVVCCAVVMYGADRVRAGQWETTLTIAGRTVTKVACVSELDAAAMNGDVASVRAFVDKNNVKTGCKTTDLDVNGNQIMVRSLCSGKENIGTTTYKGETLDTANTNGAKAHARWVGVCK
jgi:hypothetical protein